VSAIARTARAPLPGGAMLSPIALLAVGLLVLNDHVLKAAHPGFVTGKLSDLAGLVFFPLLLTSVFEVVLERAGRFRGPSLRIVLVAVLATALVFALVKTTSLGAEAYRVGLGAMQWPFFALRDLVHGVPFHGLSRVAFTRDPSDLLALPALLVPLGVGAARARRA
jgi:hypothetical protein